MQIEYMNINLDSQSCPTAAIDISGGVVKSLHSQINYKHGWKWVLFLSWEGAGGWPQQAKRAWVKGQDSGKVGAGGRYYGP